MTPDQIVGKTFTATRSFFGEYNLSYNDVVVFTLSYTPAPAIEEDGGATLAGLWNGQKWEIQHFRKFFNKRFSVLHNGKIVLQTSVHHWQFGMPRFVVETSEGKRVYQQKRFSLHVRDELGQSIVRHSIAYQIFNASISLTIGETADPETALPLLIYLMYATLLPETP